MSSFQKAKKKFLIIFDFDGTVIDKDSEDELLKKIFSKEDYNKVMSQLNILEFFDGFNYYFRLMKKRGLTLKDINSILDKIELSPKMFELLKYLRENKYKFKIIICSVGIDYSIKYILNRYGFLDLFDEFICTKGNVQSEKSDRLIEVPNNQFPHDCENCYEWQCKSHELNKFLEKNKKFEKILFVCDGSNDYCPTEKILKQGDIVFPRKGQKLHNMLLSDDTLNKLTCEICPWEKADEIIFKLKGL